MTPRLPFLEMVPAAVLASAEGQQVVEMGMGAGPGCIAQRTVKFDPTLSIPEALHRLEELRSVMKKGRILLDDGRTWFFVDYEFRGERQPGWRAGE